MCRLISTFLLAALGLLPLAQVLAQQNIPLQKEYYIGEGDVELHTGSFAYSNTDIAIGAKDQGGALVLTRYFGAHQQGGGGQPFGTNTAHNYEINLFRRKTRNPLNASLWDYQWGLTIGRTMARYGYSNVPTEAGTPPYGSAETAGSTLISSNGPEGPFVYTMEDGTRVEFPAYSAATFCPNFAGISSTCVRPSVLIKPNGERLTFTYEQYPATTGPLRVRTVISNRGYGIGFDYYSTAAATVSKVCVVNLTVQYLPPSGPCPASARAATYGYVPTSYASTGLLGYVDPSGATTNYSYANNNVDFWRMVGIRNPGSVVNDLTNVYDSTSFKITSQTYADGSTWTYTYESPWSWDINPGNGWTHVTNPLNQTTRHEFYSGGSPKPSAVRDPLNRQVQFQYAEDRPWLVQREINPEGNFVEYSYDSRENRTQTRIVAKPGSGLADRFLYSGYPATCTNRVTCNKPQYTIDARGNRTDYTYDPTHGGVLTETFPAPVSGGVRPQKRYSYAQFYASYLDGSGSTVQAPSPIWLVTQISECRTLASCAGTADETVTEFTYGSPGVANNLLVTSKTVRAGDYSVSATTSWTYDEWGNTLTEDGPLVGSADTTRTRYDAMNRVVGIVSPDPDDSGPLLHRAVRNTYDEAGRLQRTERGTVYSQSDADWAAFAPLESTENTYDIVGRLVRTTRKSGAVEYAVTQTSYDGAWRPECTAIRMDPAQWGGQINACVPQTSGPNGPDRISRNIYNAAGEVVTKQLGVGTADQADEETYTYTPNGKPQTVKDGENNLTTYEYDGFDRLSRTRYPIASQGAQSSSSSDYEQLWYDANGNITQRRLRDGQVIYSTYDALNRPVIKDLPSPEMDVSYSYDLQGRPETTSQGSAYVSLTYDALGRVLSEVTTSDVVSYQLDAAGRRVRTTWSDGFYVTRGYLTTGEVTSIRELGAYSGIGVLATYAYDNLGRRVSVTRGNGTVSNLSYDAVSRLTGLSHDLADPAHDVSSTFTYNPASQIATWHRNNGAYAWTAHANQSKTYAINGLNQIASSGAVGFGYDGRGNLTNQGASAYSYTAENRLVSGPGGTSFVYDPLGRLSRSTSASGTTIFVYDGTNLIAEYNPSNQLLRRYVHGPGVDEPLVWYEGSSTADRRWFHQDERGSVVALTDNAGLTVAINAYDEYGVPAPTNQGRFQYTGQTWMPELGMYYYKARIYSPTLGRFLQTDPIGYTGGINWYAYVTNDPTNRIDPLGLVDYKCDSPGKGNCNPNAVLRDGDTITVGEVTMTIHEVSNGTVSYSINSPSQCGAPQTFVPGLAGAVKGNPGNAMGLISQTASAAGIGGSVIEHASGKTTIGSNGRLYKSGWGGGGRGNVKTVATKVVGKTVTKAAFGVSLVNDGAGYAQGKQDGVKTLLNIGMGVVGFFPPVGTSAAVSYFGGDIALSVYDENQSSRSVMEDFGQ